jgi:hypothetical protein
MPWWVWPGSARKRLGWQLSPPILAAVSGGSRLGNGDLRDPRFREHARMCLRALAKLLSTIPDPDAVTGRHKLRRMRNQLMVGMMALQALGTIEVQRANVEDLTEEGEHLVLLVRGKT